MPAKKIQLRRPTPEAAYLIADGISAEEAAAQGLIVVENDAQGNPLAFGMYEDAPAAESEAEPEAPAAE